jgi:hypothetical protein
MTSRTDVEGADNATKPPLENAEIDTTRIDNVIGTVFFGLLAVFSILIVSNGRELTPDFVDRANADGLSPWIMFGAFTTTFGLLILGAYALSRRQALAAMALILAGVFAMMWMLASLLRTDYDGEYNPYTRAMDPLTSQYEDLAAAKSLPVVAALIRTAAGDGRIDRGEAHDILNSRTYYDAGAAEYQRRQAKVRREVLAR